MAQQFGGKGRGAEAVIYIEDGQAGHAGTEHAVEGGHAARAHAVAHRGGDGQHRAGHQSGQHAGQGSFHAGHGDDEAGGAQVPDMRGKAVQPGHAHVGEEAAVVAPEAQCPVGFGAHGDVGRPGRDHHDLAPVWPRRAQFRHFLPFTAQTEKTALRPVAALGEFPLQQGPLRFRGAADQHGGAAQAEAAYGPHQGPVGLALGEDDLAQAGTQGAFMIQMQALQAVGRSGVSQMPQGLVRRDVSPGHGLQQAFDSCMIHPLHIGQRAPLVSSG